VIYSVVSWVLAMALFGMGVGSIPATGRMSAARQGRVYVRAAFALRAVICVLDVVVCLLYADLGSADLAVVYAFTAALFAWSAILARRALNGRPSTS
jgi:hypothetical protein